MGIRCLPLSAALRTRLDYVFEIIYSISVALAAVLVVVEDVMIDLPSINSSKPFLNLSI